MICICLYIPYCCVVLLDSINVTYSYSKGKGAMSWKEQRWRCSSLCRFPLSRKVYKPLCLPPFWILLVQEWWRYKTCKAPFKLSPTTWQRRTFYKPDALPVTQPTVSEHWIYRRKYHIPRTCSPQAQTCGYPAYAGTNLYCLVSEAHMWMTFLGLHWKVQQPGVSDPVTCWSPVQHHDLCVNVLHTYRYAIQVTASRAPWPPCHWATHLQICHTRNCQSSTVTTMPLSYTPTDMPYK